MAKGEVLIINTGGTIGMVHTEPDNPLSPLKTAEDWDEITKNLPILKPDILGVETGYHQFIPLLDSSDINYENWQQMAQVISDHYHDYKGFVILHGTDTTCYTASALSFMLENLSKPVIITGSQLPMVKPRSDAAQNLVTAIHIAAADRFKYPLIPEVCIFFRDVLIRGNRSRKQSSSGYSGFISPNYPELGKAGEHIDLNTKYVRSQPQEHQEFYANTFLDTRVMVLEMFPGFDPEILRTISKAPVKETQRIKALVLKTFGAGNAPSTREFLTAIEHVDRQGIIIVDVTQCLEGMVELGLYEASSGLLNRGVISGLDMTPEAAVCKLMYLLGKGWPREEIRRVMQLDIRGEQSLNIYNVDFDQPAEAVPTFETSEVIPGDIDFTKFKSASIRFQDVKPIGKTDQGGTTTVKVFINHPSADEQTPESDPRYAGSIKRSLEYGSAVDLFCDVSLATRKLIKPGQMASISVVVTPGRGIQWERMGLSIFTGVV